MTLHYGIDIGGTKIEFAIFDDKFERIESTRLETPREDYDALLQLIESAVVDADTRSEEQGTIGVGIPGIINSEGLSTSVNLQCLRGRNLASDIQHLLGRPISSINDVRAFVLSEAIGGAGERYHCVAGAILGTGAAGGLSIGGKVHYGRNKLAGEWGHLPISATIQQQHNLPLFSCECGLKGCAERYISGPGLAAIYEHFNNNTISAPQLIKQARENKRKAKHAYEIWLDCVANVFAQLVLHTNPDVIVVGGGLSKVKEMYKALPDLTNTHLFGDLSCPPIREAKYGDDSGVRGAAIIGANGGDF